MGGQADSRKRALSGTKRPHPVTHARYGRPSQLTPGRKRAKDAGATGEQWGLLARLLAAEVSTQRVYGFCIAAIILPAFQHVGGTTFLEMGENLLAGLGERQVFVE